MTALFRLSWAFKLFAHGNAKALAYKCQQISFGRMKRHAAHLDIFTVVFAALGKSDVQSRGGLNRIIKEQLVKIAHAIEQ